MTISVSLRCEQDGLSDTVNLQIYGSYFLDYNFEVRSVEKLMVTEVAVLGNLSAVPGPGACWARDSRRC